MSSDGDNLMLAMFQQLRDQQDRIAQLQRAATEPVQSAIRRWDVLDGSAEAVEAEPTYTMTMDPVKGVVEIRPAGVSNDHLEGLPQLLLGVEINGGAPRVYIYDNVLSGEVKHQFTALPDGDLVAELDATPDAQALASAFGWQWPDRLPSNPPSPTRRPAPDLSFPISNTAPLEPFTQER